MTTTTREKLQKEHFFIRSRTEIVEWLAKEVWTLDENALVAFIETIEKEAEDRMKRKCLACAPENIAFYEDLMHKPYNLAIKHYKQNISSL